ncbi:MAG: hypothetical protein KDG55_17260 [Rhodocyclaceae bacterium]|nr:hypothetical protein [Rhodocyclaceae bacterium]
MTLRTVVAPLLAAASLAHCGSALAFGLGELEQLSAVGEPLRVQVELIGADADLDPRCIRLSPGISNDLPWVRDARLSIVRDLTRAHLVVSSHRPANHPVLMLGVSAGCDGGLRREYALLLPPGAALARAPALAERDGAPTTSPPATTEAPPAAQPPAGPSLEALAREAFPSDRAARRRYIAAARRQAPDLFPDKAALARPIADLSRLDRDSLERIGRTPPKPRPKPAVRVDKVAPPPATPPTRKAVAEPPAPPAEEAVPVVPPAAAEDRLVLFGGEPETKLRLSLSLSDPGRSGATSEAERERLREEQRLVMALDDKIMTQMELTARIKELEALQRQLQDDSRRLDSMLAGNGQPPAAEPDRSAVVTAPAPAPVPAPEPAPPPPSPQTAETNWLPLAAVAFAGLLVVAFLVIGWRRRQERESDPEADFDFDLPESQLPELEAAQTAAATDMDTGSAEGGIEVDFHLGDESASPGDSGDAEDLAGSVDFAPLEWTPTGDDLSAGAAPPIPEDELAEEHESAVELADIMMSFGRVQGAAQTLADFIRHNPKQGVAPWIKLLDVYKAADMRGEFDGLTRQLNATFNVKVVAWDEFDAIRMAAETLESMPHIVERLRTCWPTRAAQVYLHELLRDNRDGTRQGFPIAVVDEILCLLSVLNDLVGPFRPRPGDFKDDLPPAEAAVS